MNSKQIAIVCSIATAIVAAVGCRDGDHSSTPDTTAGDASRQIPAQTYSSSDETEPAPAKQDLEAAPPIDVGNGTRPTPSDTSPRTVKSVVLSEQEPVEQHFPDGSLKGRWHFRLYVTFNRALPLYQQEAGSYEFHGPYEEYYPGGEQLFLKGNYVDGVRNGEWTFWHPDGAKAKAGQYADGKLDGQWHIWREDGTLLRTESYQDDQKHGVWKFYAEDGLAVARIEEYDRGKRMPDDK